MTTFALLNKVYLSFTGWYNFHPPIQAPLGARVKGWGWLVFDFHAILVVYFPLLLSVLVAPSLKPVLLAVLGRLGRTGGRLLLQQHHTAVNLG